MEGRFFFQAVFGVKSGWSNVHFDTGLFIIFMQVLFGAGGRRRICFLSANGKAQGALFLFLGGWEGFFFHFSLFPNVLHGVPNGFSMGSQYVPQVHNVFPNIFSI